MTHSRQTVDGPRAWELIRCTGCAHESVRPAGGKLLLACGYCGQPREAIALAPEKPAEFTPGQMVETLRFAVRRESELCATSRQLSARVRHSARADAFGEALEMALVAAGQQLPTATPEACDERSPEDSSPVGRFVIRPLIDAGNTVAAMAEIPPDDRRAVEIAVRSWRAWSAEAATVGASS